MEDGFIMQVGPVMVEEDESITERKCATCGLMLKRKVTDARTQGILIGDPHKPMSILFGQDHPDFATKKAES